MNHCIALVTLAAAFALPAQALSLRAAATQALHHDPRMSQASAEIDTAKAARDGAVVSDAFSLGFAADVGRSELRIDAPFPQSGYRTPNSMALAASQPLYNGGRSAALEEAARRQLEAALERRRDVGGKLILATLTAYLDLKRDREILRLGQSTHDTLRQARHDAGKRFDAGEATRTDVSQADARVAEAGAQVLRAEAQLRASEITLSRLLGEVPTDLDAGWPRQLPTAASREEAVRLSKKAPGVVSAQEAGHAAAAQVQLAQAEGRPQLSLDGHAVTRDDTEFGYSRLNTWAVQLKVNVPILTGGRVPAKVAEASARAAASRFNAEDVQAFYAQTAASEWEMLGAAQQVITAVQAQVQAAELSLDGVEKELRVGSRTTLDLLDAQRELLAARVNLVVAERDRAVTAFRLLAACGTLELYNVPD